MKKVNEKLYIHNYNATQAVAITFGKGEVDIYDASEFVAGKGDAKKTATGDYIKRGSADDKLLQMHKIATESPNKWQLIKTQACFIGGGGFRLFDRIIQENKEIHVPYISTDFDEWTERLEIQDYWQAACYQLAFGAELNVLITLAPNKKVESLEVIDNLEIRAEKTTGKKIERFLVHPEMGWNKSVKKDDCAVYPAYDPTDPTKYPVSVIHIIAKVPGQKFYGHAPWFGTTKWAGVTNRVPDYYDAAFKNGFFVTHHISIPDDYWDIEGFTPEEKAKAKEETLNEIFETLSSIDESNKVLVTFSKYSQDGKGILKEIKVTALPNPIKDEAFIKMFEAGNLVQASGHGVPGKLAGVQLGSAMGSSGKEIIAEANYLQDYLTPFDRDMLCKPLRIAKRIDNLEPTKWLGIARIESYTPNSTPESDKSHPFNPNTNAN